VTRRSGPVVMTVRPMFETQWFRGVWLPGSPMPSSTGCRTTAAPPCNANSRHWTEGGRRGISRIDWTNLYLATVIDCRDAQLPAVRTRPSPMRLRAVPTGPTSPWTSISTQVLPRKRHCSLLGDHRTTSPDPQHLRPDRDRLLPHRLGTRAAADDLQRRAAAVGRRRRARAGPVPAQRHAGRSAVLP
jgi:hypothetical protein